MGALAGGLGGGGGASVSASSSASAGPSASGGISGAQFNFGGINLGTQDIPLSGTGSAGGGSNAPPTIGTIPPGVSYAGTASIAGSLNSYIPWIIIGVAAIGVAWLVLRR